MMEHSVSLASQSNCDKRQSLPVRILRKRRGELSAGALFAALNAFGPERKEWEGAGNWT